MYRQELARIEAEHQAWLAAHGLSDDQLVGKYPPRLTHPIAPGDG